MKTRPIKRRDFIKTLSLGATASLLPQNIFANFHKEQTKRPNILMIAVDDLRPQLGCYGDKNIISPNIDKLAEEGVLFERAYCQQPICMASRNSLLSGYRPDYANIYNTKPLAELIPDALTLNKQLEKNGYDIWATGKIYHHTVDHKKQFGDKWIKPKGEWEGRGYILEENKKIMREYALEFPNLNRSGSSDGRGPAFEIADAPDNAYPDGESTNLALEQLRKYSDSDKPFFMSIGYRKPHLPFNVPKKYWDMYPVEKIELAGNPYLPKNATKYTQFNFNELRNYFGIPKGEETIPDDLAKTLIRGYNASVTYVDTQIGKLLEELDRLNLRENTLIVLWGDHGWKLGEHGMWGKHTPFEIDAHAPLIFSAPGFRNGSRVKALTEFVDIYPTICELSGIPIPKHLEGDSLVSLLKDEKADWKSAAYTQWPKHKRYEPDKVITAYSIKTDRYRYIEWTRNGTAEILARELYDHLNDPNENKNIADYPQNLQIIKGLSKRLDGGKGWRNHKSQ